jgi:hypothetical protein
MANNTGQLTRTLTPVDLERLGFDREEIGRIVAQRERYHPLIEEVETNQQLRQLQLLQWLYRQGRYPRG